MKEKRSVVIALEDQDQPGTRAHGEEEVTDNLQNLLAVLPPRVSHAVERVLAEPGQGSLVEIVLDLGRLPQVRFSDERDEMIPGPEVTREELRYVEERIGNFGDDNRAGIERTLHRISAIRNRSGEIVGLTCRVGRAVFGTIAIIHDLVESGQSILLLGRPGVGKTTMLREVARVLSDDFGKRVIVVDTSNEIAGDGDIPHPAIGRARRMQVPTPTAQHGVMIEAVENHMPQVIVIDEIGTELEAQAARTIAERGVQLVGTAHGNSLENLMMNPTLSDLIGGIQSVTLSDEEARRRGTQKSILERKAPPTFGVMVEIISRDEVVVHRDVASTVDAILRNAPVRPEYRQRGADGQVAISTADDQRRDPSIAAAFAGKQGGTRSQAQGGIDRSAPTPIRPAVDVAYAPMTAAHLDEPALAPSRGRGTPGKPLRIHPFGVSRNRLEAAIQSMGVPAVIVRDAREADVVITLKNYFRTKPQPIREAENRGTPVYVLRSNTGAQMQQALGNLLPASATRPRPESDEPAANGFVADGRDVDVTDALLEAEEAIGAVIEGVPSIALQPQGKFLRRLQHELADRYNVGSRSTGREPNRRVEIFRLG